MVQIVAFALVSGILILFLKEINSQLAMLATIVVSVIVVVEIIEYILTVYSLIEKVVEITKIDYSLYKTIIKIIGLGYITEFGAGIVEDFGLKSLSQKIVLAGKVIILCVAMPIIYAMLELVIKVIT